MDTNDSNKNTTINNLISIALDKTTLEKGLLRTPVLGEIIVQMPKLHL